jgi:hypothetical protein
MPRLGAGRRRFETHHGESALQQLANRRRAARHPQAEAESSIASNSSGLSMI